RVARPASPPPGPPESSRRAVPNSTFPFGARGTGACRRPLMSAAEVVTAGIASAAELLVQRRVVLGVARQARQRVEELHRLRFLIRGNMPTAVLHEVGRRRRHRPV